MDWLMEPSNLEPDMAMPNPCPIGVCANLCFIDCGLCFIYIYETEPIL